MDDQIEELVHAQFTITVVGVEEHRISKTENSTIEFRSGGDRGWTHFCTLQSLNTPEYVVDDSLVIELSMKVQRGMMVRELAIHNRSAPGSGSASANQAFAGDWARFLESGQATDVEIRCAPGEGEQVVRAHRLVLAARSSVFNRMLLGVPMRERQSDFPVDLSDFDIAVVKRFVHFLYADEVDQDTLVNPDALWHLIKLGHKYDVDSLVQLCCAHIVLAEETVIEPTLLLAEQLGLTELKESGRSSSFVAAAVGSRGSLGSCPLHPWPRRARTSSWSCSSPRPPRHRPPSRTRRTTKSSCLVPAAGAPGPMASTRGSGCTTGGRCSRWWVAIRSSILSAVADFNRLWKISSGNTRGWYYSQPQPDASQGPPLGAWTTDGYPRDDANPPPTVSRRLTN
ncbi:unnamed protein product [Prorocentrum cordatum]|uniref:BTB domain-containing protein n=1 Tax=Prorocentrum cordatum TaxID=2364126 RepID=A0ABN9VZK5_9DINO|nr:unnamed protein product [Polarella glacialis]